MGKSGGTPLAAHGNWMNFYSYFTMLWEKVFPGAVKGEIMIVWHRTMSLPLMHRLRHQLGGREQTMELWTRTHNKEKMVSREPSGVV